MDMVLQVRCREMVVVAPGTVGVSAEAVQHLMGGSIVPEGTPHQVITPDVLEKTFGARLEVLQHLGMPVVIDDYSSTPARAVS